MYGNYFRAMITITSCLPFLFGCNATFKSWLRKEKNDQLPAAKFIEQGALDNGLRYFYMRNKNPAGRCFLRLNVNVGSFDETDAELGMAHMVEHLAFDDRAVSQHESLVEWLQKNGMALGPDANAFTSADNTVYKLDLPNCHEKTIKDALSIFQSFAYGLSFKNDAIAKEKNIIDAEERELKSSQGELPERLIEHLYSGTFFASHPPLGKKETRSKFTEESISAFYKRWYRPKNISIVLVGDYGDLDPKTLISYAFMHWKPLGNEPSRKASKNPDHKHPVFVLHEKDMAHVETMFSIQPKTIINQTFKVSSLKDALALELAIDMLHMAYAQKTRVNPENIRDTIVYGNMLDKGIYELTLNVASTKEGVERAFEDAFLVLRSRAEFGFSEEDFLKARSALLNNLDQQVIEEPTAGSDDWTDKIVGFLNHKSSIASALDYKNMAIPILTKLSAEDCQNALKSALSSGYEYMFAIGALEENARNVERLRELLTKSKNKKIEREQKTASVTFQYEIPACDKVSDIKEQHLENIDAEKITLSNNIEVLLKKTKLKNDEIVLQFLTDEGYLTMNRRDFDIARIAKAALPAGGLEKHPPEELPRLLEGKQISVFFNIFDDRIQGTVITRNSDLKFALSYIKAFVFHPLYSETSLTRLKEQINIYYKELTHDISAPLQNNFLKDLTNNDYRVGFANLPELLSVSRPDLLAFHKKYISDKRLRIVAVGDFDKKAILNDISCAFSSIKTEAKTQKRKTPRLAYKSGVNKTYKVNTKDATSIVAIRYPLNFPSAIYPDHRLQIIRDIIQEMLRIKLREKKQVTYSPSVTIMDNKNPDAQNWLDITVSVSKKEAAAIRTKVKKSVEKLSRSGVSENDLLKAKEPYLSQTEKAILDNSYWAAILANNFENAETLKWIKNLRKDIEAITTKDINQLLRKYFNTKNASSAIVNATDG